MSITPPTPIARADIARWKLDGFAAQLYARRVVLVFGGYDATGNRVAEKRFDVNDDTVPSITDYLAACPAAPALRQQSEAFGSTLDPQLGGTVS